MNRWTLVVVVCVAGCGGAASTADVAAFKAANQEVALSVQDHRQRMQGVTTPQQCADERHRYDRDVRPRLERMNSLSADMDGCMRTGGHGNWADMGQMCTDMTTELDRYTQAGCTSSDTLEDVTVTNRHCDVMDDYGRRERDRADRAGHCNGGMMGGGGMM